MKTEPRFETIPSRKLLGKHLPMTLAADRTAELWRSFMPRRKEIRNTLNSDLISMQVYEAPPDISSFHPDAVFEKWAAVEVRNYEQVPEGLEMFTLPGGLYAVFHYKGAPSAFGSMAQYIFATWLPNSAYELDHRPHFAVMGEKYKGEDPESEEEIWVPVKRK